MEPYRETVMVSKRKSIDPPPLEIKIFTLQEIEQGIAKIRRRIEDVKRLLADRVTHDNQRKENVEQEIDRTIMEVFGINSPEYRSNRHHSIWHGEMVARGFGEPSHPQHEFEAGIPQTITMLEGLIDRLEEKRADISQDSNVRVKTAFEGLDLHQRIAQAASELYRDGHYRNAVLDATLALENLVKEKSRRHDLTGAALMSTVFSKNDPVLAINDLADQTDRDEQEGIMHLFMGAILGLRNPRAHALFDDSAELALEYVALLSLLAKIVEKTKRRSK
jgi:uncharacterized protein (TIGR02391 family)